jgi:hypothetical protein
LPDDAKFGGTLDTTFLLAMATPMVVIPLERIYTPAAYAGQVGDDRDLDANLSKEVIGVLGSARKFSDSPFSVPGWSYVPAYSPVFNVADGCPDDLLQALNTDDAIARAKNTPASVILRVLRNALAHGGVVYLDKNGMATDTEAMMYAFVSSERDDRRRIVGLNVLRISQSDFCTFLAAWTDWLARTHLAT